MEADGFDPQVMFTEIHDGFLLENDDAPLDAPDTTHKASRGKPPKTVGAFNKREMDMVTEMTKLYGTVGTMLFLVSPADGVLIAQGAADRAKEVVMVARHHPQMWNVLVTLTTASDYTPFFVGHGMLLVALLQNHNVLPPDLTQLFKRPSSSSVAAPTPSAQQAHYPPRPKDEMTAAAMSASAGFPPAEPATTPTTPPDTNELLPDDPQRNPAAFNIERR